MTTVQKTRPASNHAALREFVRTSLNRLADQDALLTLEVAGQRVDLPNELGEQLLQILDLLSNGHAVDVTSLPDTLTTGQAADLLGVSRPTVVALVDSGELPGDRVGTHRRIRAIDLLAFRGRRAQERREHLRELTQLSEDLGLYDT